MRRSFSFVAALISLTAFLGISPARAEQREPYKVGVLAPLSGPLAGLGEAFRRGFEMYGEEMRPRTNRFIFEDHKYDGRATVTALHKLKQSDGIDLAIVWGNAPAGSGAPVAEQQKLPMIAVSMNPDARNRRYVVSFGPPLETLVNRISEQFDAWRLKTPAAVSVDFGNALKAIDMVSRKRGGIVLKTIGETETDFNALIVNLKSKGIDGVLLFALPDQALNFLGQAQALRFFPKVLGGDVFADSSFQERAASLTPDLRIVYGAVDRKFIDRVTTRYGSAAFFFETACGYTLATLTERLANRSAEDPTSVEPLSLLEKIDLLGTPLRNLKFLSTPEYGRHFEMDEEVYRIPLAATAVDAGAAPAK